MTESRNQKENLMTETDVMIGTEIEMIGAMIGVMTEKVAIDAMIAGVVAQVIVTGEMMEDQGQRESWMIEVAIVEEVVIEIGGAATIGTKTMIMINSIMTRAIRTLEIEL